MNTHGDSSAHHTAKIPGVPKKRELFDHLPAMKVILRSLPIIELTMILALLVLEYLSSYHAGIMHHLYYKKRIYLAAYFSGQSLWLHLLPVGASLAAIAWACHRRRHAPAKRAAFRCMAVLVALILTATLPGMQQLHTSAHLLIALETCLVLESLYILALALRHDHP